MILLHQKKMIQYISFMEIQNGVIYTLLVHHITQTHTYICPHSFKWILV